MDKKERILIIDFTNFEDYPIGGYLSFARSLMDSFGAELALVGITTSKDEPVGKWISKRIDGVTYDFFAMARYDKSKTRHLIPDRLVSYLLLKYYYKRILAFNIKNIFLQRQELLLSIPSKSVNICYSFAGLENPLSISKYRYAPYLSRWFERFFFRQIKYAKTILASGDDNAIKEMIKRSKGMLKDGQVTKFPTRINTRKFRPLNQYEARVHLGISVSSTIVTTTGRLAHYKGWKFMIDCFRLFNYHVPDSHFYFVGEGEDNEDVKAYILINNLSEKVSLEGKKNPDEVALYLNASDLFIMGSYKEGWSTSLMEAIACGVPACVTEFSSATEIIVQGENGYVINGHDEDLFVQAMLKAMKMVRPVKNENVIRYSSDRMKEDLLKYWELS